MAAPVASADEREADKVDHARMRARQLFQQGRQLYIDGDYPAALGKLRQAARHYRSFRIDLSIGFTLEKLGRLAEAAHAYEMFLHEYPDQKQGEVGKSVTARLGRIKSRLGMITVVTTIHRAIVQVDGEPIARAPLQHPLYLQPGSHELKVKKEGRTYYASRILLKAGQHRRITVEDAPAGQAGPLQLTPTPGPPNQLVTVERKETKQPPPRSTPIYKRWWFWTVVGAAVVGTSVGLAVGLRDKDEWLPTADSGRVKLYK